MQSPDNTFYLVPLTFDLWPWPSKSNQISYRYIDKPNFITLGTILTEIWILVQWNLGRVNFGPHVRWQTAYCAPWQSELITKMQNHLVHHLISTMPHCALPKWMSLQNYIVNLDLHVCCQPQMPGATPTSHRCTMVHNASQWCTIQVSGVQHSPVRTKWCTM